MSDHLVVKQTKNSFISDSLVRVAEVGGSSVRTQIVNTDNADTAGVSFNFTTPGGKTVISRRWLFELNVRVTANVTGGGPGVFTGLVDAPVQDPINAAMKKPLD